MQGTKKFYKSKGIMGGLVAALGAGNGIAPLLALILGFMGHDVTGEEAADLLQGIETMITAAAALFATWGRAVAKDQVTK